MNFILKIHRAEWIFIMKRRLTFKRMRFYWNITWSLHSKLVVKEPTRLPITLEGRQHRIREAVLTHVPYTLLSRYVNKELKSSVLSTNTKSLTFLPAFPIRVENYSYSALSQMKLLASGKEKWALVKKKILFCEPLLETPGAVSIISLRGNAGASCKMEHLWCLEMHLAMLLWWREKQPITLEWTAVCIKDLGQ